MTLAAWQQRPESKGTVLLRSANPFEPPAISPNYLDTETDRKILVAGLRLARKLMRTAAMAPYFDGELYPGDAVTTDDDLLETARERGTTTFHMIGTCRMGRGADTVVDHELKVHGIDRLRVVDSSIMPNMPTSNTNAPSIVVGEKGADLVLADARRS